MLVAEGLPLGYAFSILATAPDGREIEVFAKFGVAVPAGVLKIGVPPRIVERIPPGATYEITHPVDAFWVHQPGPGPGSIELAALLPLGYKIHIKYSLPPGNAMTRHLQAQYPDLWIGELESAHAGWSGR
jgi:hypothetical protein